MAVNAYDDDHYHYVLEYSNSNTNTKVYD